MHVAAQSSYSSRRRHSADSGKWWWTSVASSTWSGSHRPSNASSQIKSCSCAKFRTSSAKDAWSLLKCEPLPLSLILTATLTPMFHPNLREIPSYKPMLKDYNYRDYALRRARLGFEKSRGLNKEECAGLFSKGKEMLEVLRRQATISRLYPHQVSEGFFCSFSCYVQ
ncbi:unnamed protein product [Discosporangium mesarthrocarpum]